MQFYQIKHLTVITNNPNTHYFNFPQQDLFLIWLQLIVTCNLGFLPLKMKFNHLCLLILYYKLLIGSKLFLIHFNLLCIYLMFLDFHCFLKSYHQLFPIIQSLYLFLCLFCPFNLLNPYNSYLFQSHMLLLNQLKIIFVSHCLIF